jgi:serine protease AprX
MCRKVIGAWLVFAFLLGEPATAQQYAFQISFTDKNNTPYQLSSPIAYLSSRALSRRASQGIAVDSSDLPVNEVYLDSVLKLTGGIMHETSRWLNMCVILVADSSVMHTLDGKTFVSSTKLVAYYASFLHHKIAGNPGSPSATNQQLKKTSGGDSGYYGDTWGQTTIVNGNYLYDKGFSGAGKLIAVLDAGFLGTDTHPGFDSLWSSARMVDQHNFTLATSEVFSIVDTHGTSVLSTMAGNVPGTFVGSAPSASYALYITEDNNSEQPIEMINMLCGAERADSLGADIITTSLGYNVFDYPFGSLNFATDLDGKTTTASIAVNKATKKGILFVATAGNEGGDSWNNILTPGDADSALTIGSVEISGINAFTSGYGPNAAGQTKPDVCAIGQPANVFTQTGYGTEDGTSFSTPQIAGWAACLWEGIPSATPYLLRQAIIKCASSYSTPGPQIGYGIPNFECTYQALDVKDTPPPFSSSNWVIAMPNPFRNDAVLAVAPNTSGEVEFSITDVSGKKVMSWQQYFRNGYNTPMSIPMQSFAPGVYFLKATSATQQQVQKLLKN